MAEGRHLVAALGDHRKSRGSGATTSIATAIAAIAAGTSTIGSTDFSLAGEVSTEGPYEHLKDVAR